MQDYRMFINIYIETRERRKEFSRTCQLVVKPTAPRVKQHAYAEPNRNISEAKPMWDVRRISCIFI